LRRNPAPGKTKFRTLIRDGRDRSGSDGNRIGVRQEPDEETRLLIAVRASNARPSSMALPASATHAS
jgi:hypothetical protein